MKTIPMYPLSKNMFTTVDDEDYEYLSKYKWFISKNGSNRGGYYARRFYYKDSKYRSERMHNVIMKPQKGLELDHINHDTLDNRKQNLRLCTRYENLVNRKKGLIFNGKPTSSIFKGVSWRKSKKRWIAASYLKNEKGGKGKHIYLGTFHSEVEAAQTYDEFALKEFGEFANINFPKSMEGVI